MQVEPSTELCSPVRFTVNLTEYFFSVWLALHDLLFFYWVKYSYNESVANIIKCIWNKFANETFLVK